MIMVYLATAVAVTNIAGWNQRHLLIHARKMEHFKPITKGIAVAKSR